MFYQTQHMAWFINFSEVFLSALKFWEYLECADNTKLVIKNNMDNSTSKNKHLVAKRDNVLHFVLILAKLRKLRVNANHVILTNQCNVFKNKEFKFFMPYLIF